MYENHFYKANGDIDFHSNYANYICDEDQEFDSSCSQQELVIDKTILLSRSVTVGRIIIKGLDTKYIFHQSIRLLWSMKHKLQIHGIKRA